MKEKDYSALSWQLDADYSGSASKVAKVELCGCDDTTTFYIAVNDDEYKFLQYLSEISSELSEYGCMPTLQIDQNENDRFEDN